MEEIDIVEILDQEIEDYQMLNESGCYGQVKHLYNDGKLTFGDLRDIFKQVFVGGTQVHEKVDGVNFQITFKDGSFGFANNKTTQKNPLHIDMLESCFGGQSGTRDAFKASVKDLSSALSSIGTEDLELFFENGQKFLNVTMIYPPVKNIIDYGNKCLLQLNGVSRYDKKFNLVGEDAPAAERLFKVLKSHNALKQELFEITQPNILRVQNSMDAEESLTKVCEQLDKLTDGLGYRCTIADYVKDRIKKHIINSAMKRGIDLDPHSDFVNEFADRINRLSTYRPTKTDLMTYAKKSGINVHGDDYKNLVTELDATYDTVNDSVLKPIEDLVIEAGILAMKNMTGYLAADPGKNSQTLVTEIENAINEIEHSGVGISKAKIKQFYKNFDKIEQYKKSLIDSEGCLFNYKGRVYKLTGTFGPISKMLDIIKTK